MASKRWNALKGIQTWYVAHSLRTAYGSRDRKKDTNPPNSHYVHGVSTQMTLLIRTRLKRWQHFFLATFWWWLQKYSKYIKTCSKDQTHANKPLISQQNRSQPLKGNIEPYFNPLVSFVREFWVAWRDTNALNIEWKHAPFVSEPSSLWEELCEMKTCAI